MTTKHQFHTAIVGTGFSGLGMAIRLKQAGRDDFVLLDKANDIGGTWRDNTYPGCACDVPAPLYSYSFKLRPEWSRLFAPQEEIQQYLQDCKEEFGITNKIRFNHQVQRLRFDQEQALWHIECDGQPTITARHVGLGVGPLHHPKIPEIPGKDDFEGPSFHTADYNHSVDLEGKRVAVIGTGASAIQLVPELAQVAERVDVYQRTAPWIVPRPDLSFSARARALFKRIPATQRALRYFLYWWMEIRGLGFTLDPRIMRRAEQMGLDHIADQIDDPELRNKVTPDYTPGCKRILLSNNYYPALAREHVNLLTQGIERITANGVVDESGTERKVDAVVWATGFAVTDYLHDIDIVGLGDELLEDAWKDSVEAHLGTMTVGFPNLYFLMGPNTGLGHSSMVFMLESQLNLVLSYMDLLDRKNADYGLVRSEQQDRFIKRVQTKLDKSVWHSGCTSWYLDEDGNNFTVWPSFTFEFWARTRKARARDYELLSATKKSHRSRDAQRAGLTASDPHPPQR